MANKEKITYHLFPTPILSPNLKKAWESIAADNDFHGYILAMNEGKKPIGFLQYKIIPGKKIVFLSGGTVVSQKYRKMGIGFKMWKKVLKAENPEIVQVCIVSEGGKRLIEKVQEKFSHLTWDTW